VRAHGVRASSVVTVLAVAVLAAVALGGCGANGPRAQWSDPASPPPASGAANPSPLPTLPDKKAMQRQVSAAVIARNGLVAVGGPRSSKEDKVSNFKTTDVCGEQISADLDPLRASQLRVWSTSGLWARNVVHMYGRTPGEAVVAQVKAAAESCTQYQGATGRSTLLGPVDLPSYPGTEASYGYCYRTKSPDGEYIACDAYLATGNIVSTVMVLRGPTQSTNRNGLIAVAAVAAETLAKAA
jgi:hypothetical protein